MKVWLDDVRPAPAGWIHVLTVTEAIELLLTDQITEISLDHDLGDYESAGGSGIKVIDWLAEFGHWPPDGVHIHSANPVGRESMQRSLDRYSPYA